MAIDVINFDEDVLQASYEKPVVVDFWAPWCGPCRQLGPILERVADEQSDKFRLAKLNTDEDQMTAMKYGIRSIPAVKLFVNGEVTDEFLGAIPESQVRSWLANALPSEVRALVQEARSRLEQEDEAAAADLFEQALALEPANADAAIGLANLLVFQQPDRALELAKAASRSDAAQYDAARSVELISRLLSDPPQAEDLRDEPARTPYLEGVSELARGDVEAALGGFVASVRLNRHFNEEGARRACLALFNVLGPRHPLTVKHRRALEMALF